MRKTWKIRCHQNSLTLNILPLFCAKIGKEIVLSAPYYRQVIALSPHILRFKAQINAAPKIKLYDKWSHKTPYQKSDIGRTFRFSRLQSQLQGNDCDKVALGVFTPVTLCVCVHACACVPITIQTFTAPSHNCFVRTFTSSFGRTHTVQLCNEQCTCPGFLSSLIRNCIAWCLVLSLIKCPYQSSGTSYETLNMPQVVSSVFILGVSIFLPPAPETPWRAVYVDLVSPFSSHRAEAERWSNLLRSATIQSESLMTEKVFSN